MLKKLIRIKYRLIGMLLAAVLVPMLAMLYANNTMMTRAIRGSYQEKIQSEAQQAVTRHIPGELDKAANYIGFLAADSNLGKAAYYATVVGSLDDLEVQLPAFQKKLGLSFMELVGKDGKVIASTLADRKGNSIDISAISKGILDHGIYKQAEFTPKGNLFRLVAGAEIQQRGQTLGTLLGGYMMDRDFLLRMVNANHISLIGPGSDASAETHGLPRQVLDDGMKESLANCAKPGSPVQCGFRLHETSYDNTRLLLAEQPLRFDDAAPMGLLLVGKDTTAMDQELAQARNTIVGLATIFCLLAMAGGWFFASQISTAMAGVATMVQSMAQGDLTRRVKLPKMKDEIHDVAEQVNVMGAYMTRSSRGLHLQSGTIASVAREFEQFGDILLKEAEGIQQMAEEAVQSNAQIDSDTITLRHQMEQVTTNIDSVCSSIDTLNNNISTIAAAAEEASQNVNTMASAAEEMNVNVGDVNKTVTRVDQSVASVADAVRGLSSALDSVRKRCQTAAKETRQANTLAQESGQIMGVLNTAANEIGKVVDMINNIAEQTNMLALNAAIESAGAGEAGKGFAVVANEVKELARQTGDATQLISNQIQEIQKLTSKVSSVMKDMAGGIQQVDVATREIQDSVNEQSESVGGIARSMEQVSQASGEMKRNASELESAVREVARAAAEAAMGTREIAHSSSDLSQAAEVVSNESINARQYAQTVQGLGGDILFASVEVQKKGLRTLDAAISINGWIRQSEMLTLVLNQTSKSLLQTATELKVGEQPFDVQAVKQAHLNWLARLGQAIRGGNLISLGEVKSGRECGFGKWYYSVGEAKFGNLPLFKEVGQVHLELHEKGKRVYDLGHTGQLRESIALLEEIQIRDRAQLFDLLDLLYQSSDAWEQSSQS